MALSKITNESLSAGVQTAMTTDLSPLKSDILKLALHQAIDGNRVAYNLEDSFVDGFEDDSGITTETTVDRDTTGEYVNSTQPATATSSSSSEWNGGTSSFTFSGTTITSNTGNVAIRTNDTFAGDCKLEHTVTTANDKMVFGFYEISEDGTFSASAGRGGMDSMTNSWFWRSEGTDAIYYGGANQASQAISDGSTVKIERLSGVWKLYVGGSVLHTWSQQSTNTVRIVFSVDGPSASSVYSNVSWTDITDTTISSTGTLISDPQTASTSRTSASGVIIYEDQVGTNTLGSDLKIYFSCNNSAWTEAASYGTATTYSGTKKLVKLGATTCTAAGTSIAMKAVWANQATSTDGQIAGGTGTAIGTMTGSGGLAALFDGNTAQSYSGGATGPGGGVGWAGKSWGSVKTITKVIVYPWSGGYFGGNSATNMSITIEGSTDAAFTSPVVLETKTGLASVSVGTQTFTSLITTTGYAHHRVRFSNGIGGASISEVEFFETPVTGKEARLHGWACNF